MADRQYANGRASDKEMNHETTRSDTKQKRSIRSAFALRVAACGFVVACFWLALVCPFRQSSAQSGVLVPSSLKDKPDESLLSLQVLNVDVLIDNQHARVRVRQIFDNHTAQALEGKYLFALPPDAAVSDFAVWDADTRIPGVMLEKRRANAIYGQLKQPQIDPGLLQQDDEHEGRSAFNAKVWPIPAYGTKRVEMEYTEMLPVEGLSSHFTFPLKPSFGAPQHVGEFSLHLHVLNDYPFAPIAETSQAYALNVTTTNAHEFEGEFQARDIELKEDFSFDYRIDVDASALSVIAYRAPEQVSAYDLRDPALAARNPDGYFAARAIFNEQRAQANHDQSGGDQTTPQQPRHLIILFDTSLSMYGDKLARAVEALDYFLHSLTPQDSFNLVLFNEDASTFAPSPVNATPDEVERALAFVKGSLLGGGTDLRKALTKGLELAALLPAGERSLVLISDANPTLGTTNIKQITQLFDNDQKSGQRKRAPDNNSNTPTPVRVFAFALGRDANQTLLETLAQQTHGYFASARETEDITTQLQLFFAKVGVPSIEGLHFTANDPANFYQIYATPEAHSFDGSSVAFVGRYKRPEPQTNVSVVGQYGRQTINLTRTVALPEFDDAHEHLPRVWARARVDALLREMDLNGEREDYIAEIIRLAQKYKFVTPYTAFLAAPRALLRPRLIQPGDPVLRVKTDESIKSVFAVLPFGETQPLKFLAGENVWEVRFLAPAWLPDGTYRCRLLLTDKDGRGFQEEKSFVVDSHAPKLRVSVPVETVRAGDELPVRVSADKDTVRLIAKFYGAEPVQLFWSDREQACVGRLRVPQTLAAGQYVLTVTAEDFAHNQSSAEVRLEVIGR
jgi:Ca-activated chloride channel family protein